MTSLQTLTPFQCAELIGKSKSVVALTGAGISTAAGIPDFRGPHGLYVTQRYDPVKVFEINWFLREPQFFYQFTRDFVDVVKEIRPTFTHRFLAALERAGRLTGVVTQNIDLLHQQAGSHSIIELHGSYASASCMDCGKTYTELTYVWWDQSMSASQTPPVARCSDCSGLLKPDIVFFGEPVNGFKEAEQLIFECDLLLVLGSTLQVAPASQLPYVTRATTLVVNKGEVALASGPNRFFVEADLNSYFQEVSQYLGLEIYL